MATNGEPLLLDTSAAIAHIDRGNPFHQGVRLATRNRPLGLAGHAAFELLSALTRLPGPKRLDGQDVILLMDEEFPHSRFLSPTAQPAMIRELVALGILGGSVYDGLVGLAARAHGLTLVTCDRRAKPVYDALGVTYVLVE
ncbi:MAG: type II toxin-antitoxin system VapC family toxin [Bifidobacteriaceae bacterium]|nr:type II toxin-antitoxin system VapC family toxin [Bifidobacteriaceae bacterium]